VVSAEASEKLYLEQDISLWNDEEELGLQPASSSRAPWRSFQQPLALHVHVTPPQACSASGTAGLVVPSPDGLPLIFASRL